MKNIQDIINELVKHPDYVSGIFFTKDEVIENMTEYLEERDYEGNFVEKIYDHELAKRSMDEWINRCYDFTGNPLDYITEEQFGEEPEQLITQLNRDNKIQKLIK